MNNIIKPQFIILLCNKINIMKKLGQTLEQIMQIVILLSQKCELHLVKFLINYLNSGYHTGLNT